MEMVKMCYFLSMLLFFFVLLFYFGSSRFWESFYRKWFFIWCSRMYFNMPLMCVLNMFIVCVCVLACCSLKYVPNLYVQGWLLATDRHKYVSRWCLFFIRLIKSLNGFLSSGNVKCTLIQTHSHRLCRRRRRRIFIWPDDFFSNG